MRDRETGRTRHSRFWLLAAAMVATLFVAAEVPAHACLGGGILDVIYVRTFDVEIEADGTDYQVGDTVTVQVTARRPAKEDPAGLGNPTPAPQQMAAEGVRVAVSLKFSKGLLFNWGITDANGQAQVEIELDDRITPGPAKASAYAWVSYPAGCTRIDETGFVVIEDFVTAHAREGSS